MESTRVSEFRCLTGQEVADAVCFYRKRAGMKQYSLAVEAGVDQRTIQRIETGVRVSEETLGRVAKALHLPAETFIGPRDVPTKEEALRRTNAYLNSVKCIGVKPLTSVAEFEALLGSDGAIWQDAEIAESHMDLVAEFKDLLSDWSDVLDMRTEHALRLRICREIFDLASSIVCSGYAVLHGRYRTDDGFDLLVITIRPNKAEAISQALVPRRFVPQFVRGTLP